MIDHEASDGPARNLLLGALPCTDLDRIGSRREAVDLPAGHRVLQPGQGPLDRFHFLTAGIAGLAPPATSRAGDVATVGREGGLGMSLVLGDGVVALDAVMRVAGHGFALPAEDLRAELALGGPLQLGLLAFAQSLMARMALSAACHRCHSAEEQLSGWILGALDRVGGTELDATPAAIADSLGMARPHADAAAGRLRAEGLLDFLPGGIRLRDRRGLEQRACDCYRLAAAPADPALDPPDTDPPSH